MLLRAKIYWVAALLIYSSITFADNNLIIYPKTSQPYYQIFEDIKNGFADTVKYPFKTLLLEKGQKLTPDLQSISGVGVLSLGNSGVKAGVGVKNKKFLLAAAVTNISSKLDDENAVVLNYTPHPKNLFVTLKKLTSARQVHVVYNPNNSQWLMDVAHKTADEMGIELVTLPAYKLSEGAKAYQSIVKKMDKREDAIWLLYDKTIFNSGVVLPMILEASWRRDLIVFSSRLADVSKGVLFGSFPDNYAMGERLGEMFNQLMDGKYEGGNNIPLENLKRAINVRTAKHMGLKIPKSVLQEFDLILPAK